MITSPARSSVLDAPNRSPGRARTSSAWSPPRRKASIQTIASGLVIGVSTLLLLACSDDDSPATPAILRDVECVRPSQRSPLAEPGVWDAVIASYERADAENPPPPDPIVFVGSSSIAFWSTLAQDMAPLPAINRGFGGSVMAQAVEYVPRIVRPYRPRAVVLYEGDNDIGFGLSADCVLEDFDRFVSAVRTEQSDVPIYVLSIKPSLARAALWSEMERANALIEARADRPEVALHRRRNPPARPRRPAPL